MNKYFSIIDKQTGEVIFRDLAVNEKIGVSCISFDYKHFFKRPGTDKYYIQEEGYVCDNIIAFDADKIPKNYNIILYKYHRENPDADVLREFDITELDPEVTNLVHAINSLKDIETTGSCSGHNKGYLYVDIRFKTLIGLKNFIYILQDNGFYSDFILSTDKHIKNNTNDGEKTILKLNSLHIGQQAYDNANKLANFIKELNNVF